MSEKKSLIKIQETHAITQVKEEQTLLDDVATEMNKKFKRVNEIISTLEDDTRKIDITNEDGEVIGQRTALHPQLLSWYKEARLFLNDLWKLTGGEVKQEGEKEYTKMMAKIILEGVNQNPDFLKEKFDEWAKNRSFKKSD